MSRFNYSTTRNKPIRYSIPKGKKPKYKLESADIRILSKKYFKFNDWEIKFYESLRFHKWSIISDKQWNIVKQLLSK